LAWNCKQKDDHEEDMKLRKKFEENLVIEGLELEYDIKEERDIQYVKIHATWEVLSRYAEIIKIRMPMKEVPQEIRAAGVWEVMTDYFSKIFKPFELDPKQVPPLPKKFTCIYQRDREYLFAIPEKKALFFSHSTRSRIVDYILRRKRYTDGPFAFGIKRLLNNGAYAAAYPLHEGSWKPWTKPSIRRLLYEHWAHWSNFYKIQPLDYIRTYFGEKIGLYFAWLGFYTWMLVPASIVGLIVFIYSVATINDNIVAKETCNPPTNITMCPQCDVRCPYWDYSISCSHARASHMFDNGATVFFAVFMSLWGTVFLEFWKREQAAIQFHWNLLNFEEEEQPPRPEYLMRLGNTHFKKKHPVTGEEEPFVPFWRKRVPVIFASFSVMIFMVMIAIG
jgi:anoctamin-1